ncbi:PREDICTED: uncharacterized protein LOC109115186 [Nelumbo nucifera]|uniref:Uncharacterized protein LOC109115186 n=1 Tax=Nelumbo nucifera TaxID=4432 RepID=A0A1U8Q766_NELNU|nr:PREDICTED: uncharacterized protein LOC109115186 [Nelumbo nucifera]
MAKEYEMIVLGLMRYFLGIKVKQRKVEIFMSQEMYIDDLLKRFHMSTCKPLSTPMAVNENLSKENGVELVDASIYRSLVGSLILSYQTTNSVLAVSIVSRYMNNPSKVHSGVAKRILRYVKRTKNFGLKYESENDCKQVGFSYND